MGDQASISVLVPVYNVKTYLRQCLDSLCAQNVPDIEFICLNDGSTDGSGEILHEYAARDGRFRVIDKPNSGYGMSMNRGLDEAQGKYIGIVEPDDFIEPAMMRRLFALAEKHDCDLVKSNYYAHCDGRSRRFANLKGFPYGRPFDPVDHPSIVCTVPSIWAALYRREMVEKNGIRFSETPGASFQDTGFSLKAWFAARTVALLRRPLLHYRVDNPSSSSAAVSEKPLLVRDEVASAERFLRAQPVDRQEKLLPWFHVDKLGKYKWCYERIAPEHLPRFVLGIRSEYETAQAAGELDLSLFSEADRRLVEALLAGEDVSLS